MNQAQAIVEKFGSVKKLADAIGVGVPAVYKWTYPKERNGTGGLIPADKQLDILEAAKRLNIELKAEDFFPAGSFDGAA